MKTIPFEILDPAWDVFFDENEEKIQERIGLMSEQQPLLMVYLMSIGEDVMTEDEQESLFAYGAFAWNMLEQNGCKTEVTETILDEVEGQYAEMLDELEEQPPEVYVERINKMLESHNQSPLLNYILDVLDTEVEEEITGEENAGMMFTIIQVTVDTLLKAQAANN